MCVCVCVCVCVEILQEKVCVHVCVIRTCIYMYIVHTLVYTWCTHLYVYMYVLQWVLMSMRCSLHGILGSYLGRVPSPAEQLVSHTPPLLYLCMVTHIHFMLFIMCGVCVSTCTCSCWEGWHQLQGWYDSSSWGESEAMQPSMYQQRRVSTT